MILTFCLSVIFLALIAYALFQYVIFEKKEQKSVKSYFKLDLKDKKMIFAGVAFLCSVGIMFYSYYLSKSPIQTAVLNGSVFLWLCAIGYIDFKKQIIPNMLILAGLIFWAVYEAVSILVFKEPVKETLIASLLGGGVCGLGLLLISLLLRSALGMGDVKLMFVLGLLYGLVNVYSILLFSIIVMAAVAVILLLMKKVNRKSRLPMAPFVIIGFLIGVFAGM